MELHNRLYLPHDPAAASLQLTVPAIAFSLIESLAHFAEIFASGIKKPIINHVITTKLLNYQ
jgi:hypothetical protein